MLLENIYFHINDLFDKYLFFKSSDKLISVNFSQDHNDFSCDNHSMILTSFYTF